MPFQLRHYCDQALGFLSCCPPRCAVKVTDCGSPLRPALSNHVITAELETLSIPSELADMACNKSPPKSVAVLAL